MVSEHVRVRFAPSPTGMMHLGNIRAALIDYLFAQQKKGVFVLRIEDTDPQRNVDPAGKQIIADLQWLGLTYDEGPIVGGTYGPYLQSERSEIYQKHLDALQQKGFVYECFCTAEELDRKKQRQIALKMPPRYDRQCLKLTRQEVEHKRAERVPFIWRFKLPDVEIAVTDFARGTMRYNLKNFSDFPLTRQDGSFTFVFANFVDDLVMHITHVFRGEEHLSSTALQAIMYQAFGHPIPTFWHFPIICNETGKKLSKRDFGFSLDDLKKAGFFAEAIVNYLAILGGSFEHEIMRLSELAQIIDFEKTASAGFIKYDVEKLRWVNHQWMQLFSIQEVAQRCQPLLVVRYPAASAMSLIELASVILPIRKELVTLTDVVTKLQFYFERPHLDIQLLHAQNVSAYRDLLRSCISEYQPTQSADEFVAVLKLSCKSAGLPLKDFFSLIRIALTGSPQGVGIKELWEILPVQEAITRLNNLLHTIS